MKTMAIQDYMLSCPVKKYLGVECFGCGTQRALLLVFQGRFSEAFHMFPAIYTLILFFGFGALSLLDTRRSYGKVLVPLGLANALIMVVSYFVKHPI